MYRKPTRSGNLIRHLIIWVFIFFCIFPIIWIFSASIDPSNTIVGQRLIPRNASLENYHYLFNNTQHPFSRWLFNSFFIATITSFLSVSITSLAAYAFSRFRFIGRRQGLFGILLVQIFPQMLAMVAIYLLILEIGRYIPSLGLNTHPGLILVYLGGAMGINTWLMKGYLDSIPRSLEESAYIDGASPFITFIRIIMPLAIPIIAVIFLLTFIATYSEFLLARVLLSSTNRFTLPVGMYFFIADQFGQRWGTFSAASLIGALPIVIVFLICQKYIVSGLTRGSVKE